MLIIYLLKGGQILITNMYIKYQTKINTIDNWIVKKWYQIILN